MSSARETLAARQRTERRTIMCPRCTGPAGFHAPFVFLRAADHGEDALDALAQDEDLSTRRLPLGVEVAPWPSLFPLDDPDRALSASSGNAAHGVVACPICDHEARHTLAWPGDAFFQVRWAGEVMWAWNRAHAVQLFSLCLQLLLHSDHLDAALAWLPEEMRWQLPAAFQDTDALFHAYEVLGDRLQSHQRVCGVPDEDADDLEGL